MAARLEAIGLAARSSLLALRLIAGSERIVDNSEIEIAPKALNGRVARHPQLNPTTLITLPQKAEALRLDSCKTTAWIPKRPAC